MGIYVGYNHGSNHGNEITIVYSIGDYKKVDCIKNN